MSSVTGFMLISNTPAASENSSARKLKYLKNTSIPISAARDRKRNAFLVLLLPLFSIPTAQK